MTLDWSLNLFDAVASSGNQKPNWEVNLPLLWELHEVIVETEGSYGQADGYQAQCSTPHLTKV